MKKIIAILLLLGSVAIPQTFAVDSTTNQSFVVAPEQSIEELQAQLETLLQRVKELQAQIEARKKATGGWCYVFNTNLKIGDQGEGVKALREVFRREGLDANKDMSNEYSEYIASLVTAFQEKYRSEILQPVGLRNGTGFVGVSTRAKLNKLYGCGGGASGSVIEVSAPATIVLKPHMTARVINHNGMKIALKEIKETKIVCITTPCESPKFALISVDVPGGCGINADPRCLGLPSFHQDYQLRVGETVKPLGLTITFVKASATESATFTITKEATTTTNQPPIIKGVSGPTQLTLNEAGAWKIEAYDPERASLRYWIVWGDEPTSSTNGIPESRTGSLNTQEASFTHVYSRAGVYVIAFYVSDNSGQEAKASLTVTVQ